MAQIKFYIPQVSVAGGSEVGSGSGLGFYGDAGFAASVPVGAYQGKTFITNGGGTAQGPQGNNIKYTNAGSGIIGTVGSGIGIDAIPYNQSTLNIRFSHSAGVKAQNVELRIYDRSNINNAASGVTTRAVEIVHPWATQTPVTTGSGVRGAGNTWASPGGSSSTLTLSPSPGPTGVYIGAANSTYSSTVHDWHLALSASPNTIGSKTQYGLYVSLEYL